jgi:hypothetical protein
MEIHLSLHQKMSELASPIIYDERETVEVAKAKYWR